MEKEKKKRKKKLYDELSNFLHYSFEFYGTEKGGGFLFCGENSSISAKKGLQEASLFCKLVTDPNSFNPPHK